MKKKTIRIRVEGGLIQEIEGIPEDVKVIVCDYDVDMFEEFDDNNPSDFMGGGNWKPIGPTPAPGAGGGGNEGGRFFVQGSKMNSGNFDEGFDEQAPF